jgi:RNA polymerase sigma-70 factor (ECF subfamily)
MATDGSELLTAELRGALDALVARCAAQWPDLALPAERFVARLLATWDREVALERHLASVHASDLYLAVACREGLPAALARFDALCLQPMPMYLARLRPNPAFVRDVRQLVAEKLLVGPQARIAEYSGRAPLGAWVRLVSIRTAIDAARAPAERARSPLPPEVAGRPADPELDYLRDRYATVFAEAFAAALASLGAAERTLLSMYFVDRVPLNEVAARLRISRMTVLRRVAAARVAIRAHAQRNLRTRLRLSESDFDSVFRLVRSQLDLSIASLLRGRSGQVDQAV